MFLFGCLLTAPDIAQGLSASAVFQRIPQTRWARPALGALGLLLAGTLLLSMVRVVGRFNSPKAKRRRTVDLNKVPHCFFALHDGISGRLQNCGVYPIP